MSGLYNILVETFCGIKVVKAFTMERHERRRLPPGQQTILSQEHAHRRFRRPDRTRHGIDGHLHDFAGDLDWAPIWRLNQQTHLLGVRISERPLTLGCCWSSTACWPE